jgi:hypothetical protein
VPGKIDRAAVLTDAATFFTFCKQENKILSPRNVLGHRYKKADWLANAKDLR